MEPIADGRPVGIRVPADIGTESSQSVGPRNNQRGRPSYVMMTSVPDGRRSNSVWRRLHLTIGECALRSSSFACHME